MFVEFADYQCPYCQQAAPALLKLESEYKGKVAFAFKDLPLPMHPLAEKAAEASRCAAIQGKYWDYHDTLFSTQKLEIPDLKEAAQKLNLDTAAFNKCLDSGEEAKAVQTQLEEGNRLGISGTPTFFINGRLMTGHSYDELRKAIDQELAVATRRPKEISTTASR